MIDDLFPSRQIASRVFIDADLEFTSPVHFGGGREETGSDMVLALDPRDGVPVIWGTSLAGPIRKYLNNREFGYSDETDKYLQCLLNKDSFANKLFGYQQDEEGNQSWLIVSDAFLKEPDKYAFEKRDMGRIDPKTRTPLEEHKFDADLISKGTIFNIRFELLLPDDEIKAQELRQAVAIALEGFEKQEIPLGAKTSRGWGDCVVRKWKVCVHDFGQPAGIIAWLKDEHSWIPEESIAKALDVPESVMIDHRSSFEIDVHVKLTSPLMIGSIPEAANRPDSTHITRKNVKNVDGEPEWVVPATSLAGVIRSQSNKILKTLGISDRVDDKLLWGYVDQNTKTAKASRVHIKENILENVFSRIQMRIKINPFTGGAYPGALFNQEVIIAKGTGPSNFILELHLDNPKPEEIGLLLHCMRDICTEDLTIGDGWGIGRGYMRGTGFQVRIMDKGKKTEIIVDQSEDGSLDLSKEDAESLDKYGKALIEEETDELESIK